MQAQATKTVWVYDRDGYYSHTDVAVESPLERGMGRFLVPAMATEIAPPIPAAGQRARWNGDTWELVAYNYSLEAHAVRCARNMKLAECDWTQLPDAPGWVDSIAWRNYRQDLRDIPQQSGFPQTVKWPTLPQVSPIR